MRTHPIFLAVAVSATLLTACDARRTETGKSECIGCHGGANDETGAPPVDTKGLASSPAVGAHTVHLDASVGCESCHVVPQEASSPGHIDADRATVTFGGIAGAGASYDPTTLTCSSTYCHALPSEGGLHPAPSWTETSLGVSRCNACHGFPPTSHPASATDCVSCHPKTVAPLDAGGFDIIPGGPHANGTPDVDLDRFCTECHGDAARAGTPLVKAAPPKDTSGNTATTFTGVGAHQVHLAGKTVTNGIACDDCHTASRQLPTGFAHVDGNRDIVLKRPGGAAKGTYVAGTCSATYCHGALDRNGVTTNNPSWTTASDQASCNRCHRSQTTNNFTDRHQLHVLSEQIPCSRCHPGATPPDLATHVNGTVDVNASVSYSSRSCAMECHGRTEGTWY